MSYKIKLTKEISAVYDPWKGDKYTGCSDSMEIDFFILGKEVKQPDLDAALRLQYEHELWLDLRARQEIAVLDRLLDDLVLEPSEWIVGV